jgi:hypothetical protein
MIRALLCLAPLALGACVGQAQYQVRPFYSPDLHKMVCCEAIVSSSRDIAAVSVDAVKTGDDYRIHFEESGVSASAPINANTAAVSAVAGAVSNVAVTAAKFSIK